MGLASTLEPPLFLENGLAKRGVGVVGIDISEDLDLSPTGRFYTQ